MRKLTGQLTHSGEERYQTAAGVEADLQGCLADLDSYGRIDLFPLGEHDDFFSLSKSRCTQTQGVILCGPDGSGTLPVRCVLPLNKKREPRQVSRMKRPANDALAISILMGTVVLTVWLGVADEPVKEFSPAPYKWFKDFQPLIGAGLAGFGLYVAWRNVSRQITQARQTMVIN